MTMSEAGEIPATKLAVRTFLSRHVRGEFPDDVDLFATGRINSLFALQLVMFVEKQFRVRVENEDLERKNFCSIDAISGFVERKRAVPTAQS